MSGVIRNRAASAQVRRKRSFRVALALFAAGAMTFSSVAESFAQRSHEKRSPGLCGWLFVFFFIFVFVCCSSVGRKR